MKILCPTIFYKFGMPTYFHHKHYIGNINSKLFFNKHAIYIHYCMSLLERFLPREMVDLILSFVCVSLVVLATDDALHYINPKDNALILTIPLRKIWNLNSNNNKFAISADGATFYRIYRRHVEMEYLCDTIPDPHKPPNKQTFEDTNRYYHIYNIIRKCRLNAEILPHFSGRAGNGVSLSSDGKFLALYYSKMNVVNRTASYVGVFDTKSKALVYQVSLDVNQLHEVVFSPDNTKLAVIDYDVVNYVSVAKNIKIVNILENSVDRFVIPSNVMFSVFDNTIAWSPDSSVVAATTLTDFNPSTNESDQYGLPVSDSVILMQMGKKKKVAYYSDIAAFKMTWITNNKYAFSYGPEVNIDCIDNNDYSVYFKAEQHIYDFKVTFDGIFVCELIEGRDPLPHGVVPTENGTSLSIIVL